MIKGNILIIDDEELICELLRDELTEYDYHCTKVLNGESALAEMSKQIYNVVLLDLKLPGITGMQLLEEFQSHYHDTKVIVITAVVDINTAVEAMKRGASDYIIKPFDLKKVVQSVEKVFQDAKSSRGYESDVEAIAQGVEERQDLIDSHSNMVTKATIVIAKKLGVPPKEIDEWSARRKLTKVKIRNRINIGLDNLTRAT